jgi:hydroxymethylbilane synthase
MKLIVGTRGSKLSLIQTEEIIRKNKQKNPELEVIVKIIKTTGDKKADESLLLIEEKGMFEKEIDEALIRGDIDFAVHSMKDMPTIQAPGSTIVAVPERNSPNDVLVSKENIKLMNLPKNSIIGTSSPRRSAQIKNKRQDLEVRPIRGNVDTRLNKLNQGLYDAIIVAEAGLNRLNIRKKVTERFSIEEFTPAAGQGALAIVAREDDKKIIEILGLLNHQPSKIAVLAEREFVKSIGGGCKVPLGAFSCLQDNKLLLYACILSPDGKTKIQLKDSIKPNLPKELGKKTAIKMLEMGAKELIENWRF